MELLVSRSTEAPVDQIAVSVMDIWGAKTPHY